MAVQFRGERDQTRRERVHPPSTSGFARIRSSVCTSCAAAQGTAHVRTHRWIRSGSLEEIFPLISALLARRHLPLPPEPIYPQAIEIERLPSKIGAIAISGAPGVTPAGTTAGAGVGAGSPLRDGLLRRNQVPVAEETGVDAGQPAAGPIGCFQVMSVWRVSAVRPRATPEVPLRAAARSARGCGARRRPDGRRRSRGRGSRRRSRRPARAWGGSDPGPPGSTFSAPGMWAAAYSSAGRTSSTVTEPFGEPCGQIGAAHRLGRVRAAREAPQDALDLREVPFGDDAQEVHEVQRLRVGEPVDHRLAVAAAGDECGAAELLQMLRAVWRWSGPSFPQAPPRRVPLAPVVSRSISRAGADRARATRAYSSSRAVFGLIDKALSS